jgi:hypothetical protein
MIVSSSPCRSAWLFIALGELLDPMRVFTCLSLMLIASPSFADDLPGSRDLDVLERAEHAEIVEYRESADQEKRYPLAPILRINGQLRLEREVDARGRMQAVTYRLPDEQAPVVALALARRQLRDQGAQLLYWCEGRECGSSSLWANAIFGNARLYGPEERQHYLLYRLAEPHADSLLALYGIIRGNRSAYLHAEQLDAAGALGELLPNPATLLRQLREHGELALPRMNVEPEPGWVAVLARMLSLDATLRVGLSGEAAAATREALLEQGVRATRLEIDSVRGDGLSLQVLR